MLKPMDLQLFADATVDESAENGTATEQQQEQGQEEQETTDEKQAKTYTEEDVQKAASSQYKAGIAKIMKDAGFAPDKSEDFKAQIKAFREWQDNQKSELQREKEAREKAEQTLSAKDARIIHAEAKAQASALGVEAGSIPYVLKLADLSAAKLNDDGEPDEAEIKAAIEKVLADVPALKGVTGSGGANPPPKDQKKDKFLEGFDN